MTSSMLVEEKREDVMQHINFSCSCVTAPWLWEDPHSWQLFLHNITLLGLVQAKLYWWRMWECMENEEWWTSPKFLSCRSVDLKKAAVFWFVFFCFLQVWSLSLLQFLYSLCWVHADGHGSAFFWRAFFFFEHEWKQQPIRVVLAAFVSSGCPRNPLAHCLSVFFSVFFCSC